MKNLSDIKLEEYQAAATALGTSISHLMAIDSDNPAKAMCQDADYVTYLRNAVDYRLKEDI